MRSGVSRPLFDQFVRTRVSPARHNEGRYSFLNEAASPFWDRQRQLLNEWFSRLPAECQDDLRQRYMSGGSCTERRCFLGTLSSRDTDPIRLLGQTAPTS